jgi:prophage DNA circulation protein
MKQFRHLLLLIALVAVAVAVPIAQGTTAAKDPRVTKLIKQVNALKGQVTSLQSDVSSLKNDVATLQQGATTVQNGLSALQSCVKYKAMPVADYGNGSTEGYVYARNSGADIILTSALDVTPQGATPQAYLAEVNPSCVSAATRSTAAASGRSAQRIPSVTYKAR